MDSDGDALSWDGDDALDGPARRPRHQGAGAPAVGHDRAAASSSAHGARPAREDEHERRGVSTATLVLLGIVGGVYLLYTVGWLLGGLAMRATSSFLLPAPLYLAGMWVAVLAPALWFAAVLILTRRSREWMLVAGLVIGAVLLVPWPFVVAGGGGAL